MKKVEIIKSSRDFTKIIEVGESKKNKYYSIYYLEDKESTKFGITIPTKIGKANVRNKIKRRVKNIIDHNKKVVQNNYDYVIIVKKGILDLTYKEMEEELLKLIK